MRSSALLPLLVTAALIASPAGAEPVEEAGPDVLETAVPLEPARLVDQRGGFSWAGMQISLGADIRTYINGELALQTIVSWTPQGASTTDTIFGALTPAGADNLRAGVLSTGGITMNVGNSSVYLANHGQTALIHRTDGGIQNILVNTASNVNLSQQVDATLDVAGWAPFAHGNLIERIGTSAGEEVARATSFGL